MLNKDNNGLAKAVCRRQSLMADIAERMRKSLAEEDEITAQLLKQAPKNLRNWLREEGLIRSLFDYGRYSRKIRFNKGGFKGLRDSEDKFNALGKAWGGIVKIQFDLSQSYPYFGVHIWVVME